MPTNSTNITNDVNDDARIAQAAAACRSRERTMEVLARSRGEFEKYLYGWRKQDPMADLHMEEERREYQAYLQGYLDRGRLGKLIDGSLRPKIRRFC